MTSKDDLIQNVEEFELQSQLDGVFRVALIQLDGVFQTEAFFAGNGSLYTIAVPPGNYTANVMDPNSREVLGDFSLHLPDHQNNEPEHIELSIPQFITRRIAEKRLRQIPELSIDTRASLSGNYLSSLEKSYEEYTGSESSFHKFSHNPLIIRKYHEDLARNAMLGSEFLHDAQNFELSDSTNRIHFSIELKIKNINSSVGDKIILSKISPQIVAGESDVQISFSGEHSDIPCRVYLVLAVEGVANICIPVPFYRQGTTILFRLREQFGRPDFKVDIQAKEYKLEMMVEALRSYNDEDALKVLAWNSDGQLSDAVDFLAHKKRDLWAATVAALILIKRTRYENITQWYSNLVGIAPFIPDVYICASWLALIDSTEGNDLEAEKIALSYLEKAYKLGAPNFVIANSLMLEILNNLRMNGSSDQIRNPAEEMYSKTAKRSRYRIYSTAYMIWESVLDKSSDDFLNADLQQILVEGDAGVDRLEFIKV